MREMQLLSYPGNTLSNFTVTSQTNQMFAKFRFGDFDNKSMKFVMIDSNKVKALINCSRQVKRLQRFCAS